MSATHNNITNRILNESPRIGYSFPWLTYTFDASKWFKFGTFECYSFLWFTLECGWFKRTSVPERARKTHHRTPYFCKPGNNVIPFQIEIAWFIIVILTIIYTRFDIDWHEYLYIQKVTRLFRFICKLPHWHYWFYILFLSTLMYIFLCFGVNNIYYFSLVVFKCFQTFSIYFQLSLVILGHIQANCSVSKRFQAISNCF